MNELDYIPIAALNQYAYCPHRCGRMYCMGEFVDNQYTIEGTSLHQRVHTVGEGNREQTWQVRAIWLKSEEYRLLGKADLIEESDGSIYPVKYKRGLKGEWDNDELQVAAQALCLEEMTGKKVDLGYVYYAHSHQRVPVDINRQLREETIATINAVTDLLTTGKMPKPVYSPRCQGCSLFAGCLPKAAAKLSKYQEVS